MLIEILRLFPSEIQNIIAILLSIFSLSLVVNDIALERLTSLVEYARTRQSRRFIKKVIKYSPPVVFLNTFKDGLTTKKEKEGIKALLNNTPLPKGTK